MSLLSSLSVAKNSLVSTSAQTQMHSNNILGAGDPNFNRRLGLIDGNLITGQSLTIVRATNEAVHAQYLNANAAASSAFQTDELVNLLRPILNDPDDEAVISSQINALKNELISLSASPRNPLNASIVFDRAQSIVGDLNQSAERVRDLERQVVARTKGAADKINTELHDLARVESMIAKAMPGQNEAAGYYDSRDRILENLSNLIGIRTNIGVDGALSVYTDSNVVLFDKVPRLASVSIASLSGIQIPVVSIDGVDVTSSNSRMAVMSGEISALTKFQAEILIPVATQVDEIARGLIEAFADYDRTGDPANPRIPGLFVSAIPLTLPMGSHVPGLAAALRVNPNVGPLAGGAILFRDGMLGNPANSGYNHNDFGQAGFSARIEELTQAIDIPQAFDVLSQLAGNQSLLSFSNSSIGWLNEVAMHANQEKTEKLTMSGHIAAALNADTGVNLDEEMEKMLEIEHAYHATAKLISRIDQMIQSLLQAIN